MHLYNHASCGKTVDSYSCQVFMGFQCYEIKFELNQKLLKNTLCLELASFIHLKQFKSVHPKTIHSPILTRTQMKNKMK